MVLTAATSTIGQRYVLAISKLCGSGTINLLGKTNLKQLLAIIAAADLLLCPDSGPAHMATAVGTAVVGLYATSNPARTGPYLNRDLVINAYPEACQQFLGKSVDQLRWGQRVRNADAMGLIRLGKVTDRIREVLHQKQEINRI